MARVSSKQTSLTAFPFLSDGTCISPWVYASVCFISGLLASGVLGIALPVYAEEDDLRSFVSFGVGALICCLVLKKLPVGNAATTDDKCNSARYQQKVTSEPDEQTNSHYAAVSTAATPKSSRVQAPPGLQRTSTLSLAAPPGLEQHANSVNQAATRFRTQPSTLASKPLLRHVSPPTATVVSEPPQPYTPQTFRKELMVIMRELAQHKNVGRAVNQVRQHNVPVERQAAEFADILTIAVEETRGLIRRTYIAFVGGLTGAFDKSECLAGLGLFFDGVYEDLCGEVIKLSRLIKVEVLPILNSVLSSDHVSVFVPESVMAA